MNLQLLQTFLAIVKEESISKAANSLCLSQSTVTKRLQVLENELKLSLFERGRGVKHLQLTTAGVSFLELSEKWYDLLYSIEDIKKNGPNISLSIGSLNSINFAVFPALYKNLSSHNPKIDLKIITSHSSDMFNLIEKKEIDVGLSFIAISSPNVKVFKLYSEPVLGICLKTSYLAGKNNISAARLKLDEELYVRWDSDFQQWHNTFFKNNHTLGIKLDNAQLILDLFNNDNQWAIVPASVAIYAMRQFNFSTFKLAENNYRRITYLIMHKNPKQSARLGINILLEQLHSLPKIVNSAFSEMSIFFTKNLPKNI